MSKGKYYSLEEAIKADDVQGFAKAHPSKGDKKRFDALMDAMIRKPESTGRTSQKKRRA